MNFSVHSLASGSSGNSMLVQSGSRKILLDAGVSMLQIKKRLSKFSVSIEDLDAVLLTHEHSDHSKSAYTLSRRFGLPVIANKATLDALPGESAPPCLYVLDTGCSMSIGGLLVESFPLSHDAAEPVGYNLYCGGCKVSFVTDTGKAGEEVLGFMEGADLAVVEANHDVDQLIAGPYPWMLKQRILSDMGHLSNEAAADLILKHLAGRKGLSTVWLAHLSDTNNSPRQARKYIQSRISGEGFIQVVVDVALRDIPNLTWRAEISRI